MSNKILSKIFTYPIKSLGGISLTGTELTAKGPKWDRRWMLVDQNNRFLSLRELGRMAFLQPHLEADHLRISDRRVGRSDLEIPLDIPAERPKEAVTIWDDTCEAIPFSSDADRWFSEALNYSCRLVYMPDDSFRPVDPAYARGAESVSFADGYPYLILGEASMAELNARLADPIEIERFRPNLVFSGGVAVEEDDWNAFTIGAARFRGTKPCARCQIPTIDLQTGVASKEPSRTLATYRRKNNKVYFGQNACWEMDKLPNAHWVQLGDPVMMYTSLQ